jgi:hypothetical protein
MVKGTYADTVVCTILGAAELHQHIGQAEQGLGLLLPEERGQLPPCLRRLDKRDTQQRSFRHPGPHVVSGAVNGAQATGQEPQDRTGLAPTQTGRASGSAVSNPCSATAVITATWMRMGALGPTDRWCRRGGSARPIVAGRLPTGMQRQRRSSWKSKVHGLLHHSNSVAGCSVIPVPPPRSGPCRPGHRASVPVPPCQDGDPTA